MRPSFIGVINCPKKKLKAKLFALIFYCSFIAGVYKIDKF
jgi:hypothetical protein